MTLILEDGTNVLGSNTFTNVQGVRDYAALRNRSLTSDDDTISGWLIEFLDYLSRFEDQMKGTRTYYEQSCPYPRTGIILNNQVLESDVIPNCLIYAQCEYVLNRENGVAPLETNKKIVQNIILEKTPDFERAYSDKKAWLSLPSTAIPSVMTHLKGLLDFTGYSGR